MDEYFLADYLVASLGIEPAILMGAFAFLSLGCRLIGKTIPDDATGWKGAARKVCKVVGLYVSNRVTSGVSVTDVSKAVMQAKVPVKSEAGRFTSTTVGDLARGITATPLFGDAYARTESEVDENVAR